MGGVKVYFTLAFYARRCETWNKIKKENAQQCSFIRLSEIIRSAVALSLTALPKRDYRLMMMALHPDI